MRLGAQRPGRRAAVRPCPPLPELPPVLPFAAGCLSSLRTPCMHCICFSCCTLKQPKRKNRSRLAIRQGRAVRKKEGCHQTGSGSDMGSLLKS